MITKDVAVEQADKRRIIEAAKAKVARCSAPRTPLGYHAHAMSSLTGTRTILLTNDTKEPIDGHAFSRQTGNVYPDLHDTAYGICSGASVHGGFLVIVDVDDRAKFDGSPLAAALPPTLTVLTSDKGGPGVPGAHLYYFSPVRAAQHQGSHPAGIDVRGSDNGYVCGPGSLHKTGATYRIWDDGPQAITWLTPEHVALLDDGRDSHRPSGSSDTKLEGGSTTPLLRFHDPLTNEWRWNHTAHRLVDYLNGVSDIRPTIIIPATKAVLTDLPATHYSESWIAELTDFWSAVLPDAGITVHPCSHQRSGPCSCVEHYGTTGHWLCTHEITRKVRFTLTSLIKMSANNGGNTNNNPTSKGVTNTGGPS